MHSCVHACTGVCAGAHEGNCVHVCRRTAQRLLAPHARPAGRRCSGGPQDEKRGQGAACVAVQSWMTSPPQTGLQKRCHELVHGAGHNADARRPPVACAGRMPMPGRAWGSGKQ